MTTPDQPGWYDDPQDQSAQRYWDGNDWTPHRQRKPATPSRQPSVASAPPPPPHLPPPSAAAPTQQAYLPPSPPPPPNLPLPPSADAPTQQAYLPPPPPPPPPSAGAPPQYAYPPPQAPGPPPQGSGARIASDGFATVKGIVGNFSITAWILVAGLVITLLATFFPYASISLNALGSSVVLQEVSASGPARFVVLVLVVAAAASAWPALTGSAVVRWRLIALSVIVGILAVLVVIWFTNVSGGDKEGEGFVSVTPGFGLLLYGAGVIVTAAAVIRLWMAHPRAQYPTF